MKQMIRSQHRYRTPSKRDGAKLWKLVKDSGKLDVNSPYFYITMSHWFSNSCMIVEDINNDRIIGAVVGFRQPEHRNRLFIWQITVHEDYRGQGIALKLLDELASQSGTEYVEATISPSNAASRRLFEKWSAMIKADMIKSESEGFGIELFPEQAHEQEDLYIIGPLKNIESKKERNDR